MANRRMISRTMARSDSFLELPLSAQALYFHLNLEADDDGVLNNARMIQRLIGASESDLDLLISEGLVLFVEPEKVYVLRHWKVNNQIRTDRYQETVYRSVKERLLTQENGEYSLSEPGADSSGSQLVYQTDTTGIPSDNQRYPTGIQAVSNWYPDGIPTVSKRCTQFSVVKDSTVEDSIDQNSTDQTSTTQYRERGTGETHIPRYEGVSSELRADMSAEEMQSVLDVYKQRIGTG